MARPRLRIKSKIWLEADGRMIFSDGRLALLEAVDELGSLSLAARRLGMSYRAAWGLLKVTERALGAPLLDVTIGGRVRHKRELPAARHAAALVELLHRVSPRCRGPGRRGGAVARGLGARRGREEGEHAHPARPDREQPVGPSNHDVTSAINARPG